MARASVGALLASVGASAGKKATSAGASQRVRVAWRLRDWRRRHLADDGERKHGAAAPRARPSPYGRSLRELHREPNRRP